MPTLKEEDRLGLQAALEQARKGYEGGGIPIGAALAQHCNGGSKIQVLGAGHNERMQRSSPTLHGEMSALEAAGRLKAETYRNATMYTTLSPCSMCSGAILLYKIPRVVVGENVNFLGEEDLLRGRGVEVIVADDKDCIDLMKKFIEEKPEEWFEDIGEHAAE